MDRNRKPWYDKVPCRVDWKPRFNRMQQVYDGTASLTGKGNNRNSNREDISIDVGTQKVFKRLWRICRKVRDEQEKFNIKQSCLTEGKEAITKVKGVIYAIVHTYLRRIYNYDYDYFHYMPALLRLLYRAIILVAMVISYI